MSQDPIATVEKDIMDEFLMFKGADMYDHLIEQGKDIPLIAPEFKTDDRIVKGCQSRVWLHAEFRDGRIHFTADSDAFISKGMAALLLRVFNDRPPNELMQASLSFLEPTGLRSQLSMQRAGGLVAILDQMKRYALAYSSKS